MIKKLLVVSITIFSINVYLSADQIELSESLHSYKELENAHSAAYGGASDDEREGILLSKEELEKIEKLIESEKTTSKDGKKRQLQQSKANAIKLKEDQVKLVYEMFDKTPDLPEIIPAKRASIQTNSFIDGKFFLGDPGSTLNSIHGILFGPAMTRTVSGPAVAAAKLANPSSQVHDIIANQQRIGFLVNDPQKFEQIDQVLEKIGTSEQAWFKISLRKTRSDFLSELEQQNGKSKPNKKQLVQAKKYFDSQDWTWDSEKGNILTRPARSIMGWLTRNSEVGTFLLGNSSFSLSGLKLFLIFGGPIFVSKLSNLIKLKTLQHLKATTEKELEANPNDVNLALDLLNINRGIEKLKNAPGLFKSSWNLAKEVPGVIKAVPELVKDLNETRKADSKRFWLQACGFSIGLSFHGFVGYLIISTVVSNYLNIHNTISGILEAQKTLCEMRKLKDQMRALCTLVDPQVFPEIIELKKFVDCKTLDTEFDHLLKQLDSWTFASGSSLFSRHGRTIQAFIALEKLKDRFAPAMKIVGQIDCMMAVVKNIKKTEGLANGFCLPEIVEGHETVFEIIGMWNPFVGPENSVPNNLFLGAGSSDGIYGAVISGPNFGGKTVYILGTFSAAVLVQCFGFAPAKSMRFAPFDGFVTYVKVNDNPPIDSLFSAQCRKMRELFDLAWKSKEEDLKVLIIADELLTGTKFTYAESLVRSAIREFSSLGGCVYLLATHFPAVTGNLEKDSRGKFRNMQVCANLDSEGFFDSPTFKVSDGESHTDAAFKVAASRFGEKYQHIIDNAKPLVLEQMSKKDKTRAMA